MINFKAFLMACLVASVATASAAQAQTSYERMRSEILERQQSTRSQIETLDEQIATYTRRLSQTTEEYDEEYQQFEELNRLISLQRERLRQMNRQQRQIQEEITLIQNNQAELRQRLTALMNEYKESLTYLYKHGRTTELVLLLTSTSINQLMVRTFYLAKFNDYLQGQLNEIEEARLQLEQSKQDLEASSERNEIALQEIQNETDELQGQQDRQQQMVESLKKDIASLESQKKNREEQRKNLEDAMENLIREEERLRRAEASGEVVVRRESSVSESELNSYEAEFREQRGELPWPVNNGTITEKFGERIHPVFGTRTRNLGVDIAVPARSTVRVVNDGYVYGIQPLQGYGEVVFVSHGDYKTAYGNLSEINVRRNQVLRKGDVIGLSGDENSIRGTVLFFLIRDGSQMVDPELWLEGARL
ncbi:murein hydrolase activator EnvC family protein [Rhodohalobacter sp. 614A]|uniref:murein hydrolase activator EnvC family protein n=1 Tax=Rhodohalobacter sp. 614A TaxID=2908649 RepID=UPI001F260C62|nr:peptidoglycan DD-metalloendopeptidase family protein [Rhodohalobacter sp. 614A]